MPTTHEVCIRDASADDVPALLDIYNEVLTSSTAIWSDEPRTLAAEAEWLEARQRDGLPVLVAVNEAELLGYASYGSFRSWPGYRYTVENSIYLAPAHRGRGIGTELLQTLVSRAREQGLHAMVAGIGADNAASLRLHERQGFRKVAHFEEVGWKFGRWLDLVFMQLTLSR